MLKKLIRSFIKRAKKNKGITLLEMAVVLAILAILSTIVIPNFTNARSDAEKKIHLLNANAMQNAAQSLILDGQVIMPNVGETVDITLETIIDSNYMTTVVDPSSTSKDSYDPESSMVQVYNNSSVLEYYIKLDNLDESQTYVDNTAAEENTQGDEQIYLMTIDDIDTGR